VVQDDIKNLAPQLVELDNELLEQNIVINKLLEESNIKRKEVEKISSVQAEKVAVLKKFTDEINKEKEESEKDKDDAIKSADKLTNKDITEINSFTNPPDSICYCCKIIIILFDEEKEVKNKEDNANWFLVFKTKMIKNINEFKEKLKKRLVTEDISERQIKKIELI